MADRPCGKMPIETPSESRSGSKDAKQQTHRLPPLPRAESSFCLCRTLEFNGCGFSRTPPEGPKKPAGKRRHMTPNFGSRGFQLLSLLCLVLSPACTNTTNPSYGKFVPFTRDLISTYSLSENDIKHLQFYVSTEILLRRAPSKGEANISKGKLVVGNGSAADEVEVPQFAPCIADAAGFGTDEVDFIEVRFEQGAPSIEFIARVDKPRDSFGLMFDSAAHSVPFGGHEYQPMHDSLHAILLVDRDMLGTLQSKRRILKGMLLPDSAK
jgi:hypothetical protein